MELFRRSWGRAAAPSVEAGSKIAGSDAQQHAVHDTCAVEPSCQVSRSAAGPLRRASPAQRSYMVALRQRCRQNEGSSVESTAAAGPGAALVALHRTNATQLHQPAPGSRTSKASRVLMSSRLPPTFAPDWIPKLASSGDVKQLQAGVELQRPPASELQSLEPESSAPVLQTTPAGATKRKRSRTPDAESPSSTQRQYKAAPSGEGEGSVVVIRNGGPVEVWDGADWDYNEHAAVLQEQLEEERAARVAAERRIRQLEHRLQMAVDEATRHTTATVKRLTKENQRLVQRLASASPR